MSRRGRLETLSLHAGEQRQMLATYFTAAGTSIPSQNRFRVSPDGIWLAYLGANDRHVVVGTAARPLSAFGRFTPASIGFADCLVPRPLSSPKLVIVTLGRGTRTHWVFQLKQPRMHRQSLLHESAQSHVSAHGPEQE